MKFPYFLTVLLSIRLNKLPFRPCWFEHSFFWSYNVSGAQYHVFYYLVKLSVPKSIKLNTENIGFKIFKLYCLHPTWKKKENNKGQTYFCKYVCSLNLSHDFTKVIRIFFYLRASLWNGILKNFWHVFCHFCQRQAGKYEILRHCKKKDHFSRQNIDPSWILDVSHKLYYNNEI